MGVDRHIEMDALVAGEWVRVEPFWRDLPWEETPEGKLYAVHDLLFDVAGPDRMGVLPRDTPGCFWAASWDPCWMLLSEVRDASQLWPLPNHSSGDQRSKFARWLFSEPVEALVEQHGATNIRLLVGFS